ncbi:hypothetical protein C5167_001085 [Papaver somniferum]|uniref:Cyclin C-terminal domain-containing protein n=1 Tax=Papaver somniferum TaxID=3469 RepID=A0A4Y7KX53_PAPSO|nr:hypothetical protein C5167_001085 [Papaver somniferum]
MELLILSTLEWKMNPATHISLLDHIIRRFGFQVFSLPSISLVAAVMLNVIDEVETENPMEYQHQLMTALKLTKEDVNELSMLLRRELMSVKIWQFQEERTVRSGAFSAVVGCECWQVT